MTRLSPDGGRTPTLGDLALGASLLAVALLSGFFIDANRPDTVAPTAWWHWLLIATPSILVAIRRFDPIVVTGLATVAQSAIWVLDLPEVLLPMIVILYTAASDSDKRGLQVAVAASAVLTIVTAIGVRIADDVSLYQLPLIVLTCGTAIALGVNAKQQRHRAEQLAAEVTEIRVRGEQERDRALSEERAHIARELHDIVGHNLSVIAVRAEAADRVAANQPEAAGAAVAAIATTARSALGETRRVLSGLRQSSAELSPAPDLDATRRLVTDLAGGGVDATLIERGCRDLVTPAVVAGGTYRIVQESLTNAIKHGGPSVAVEVQLTCRVSEVDIVVTNSVVSGHTAGSDDGIGVGLTGMAERAAILGGTFSAGRSGDRFVVHATLPTGTDTAPIDDVSDDTGGAS